MPLHWQLAEENIRRINSDLNQLMQKMKAIESERESLESEYKTSSEATREPIIARLEVLQKRRKRMTEQIRLLKTNLDAQLLFLNSLQMDKLNQETSTKPDDLDYAKEVKQETREHVTETDKHIQEADNIEICPAAKPVEMDMDTAYQ